MPTPRGDRGARQSGPGGQCVPPKGPSPRPHVFGGEQLCGACLGPSGPWGPYTAGPVGVTSSRGSRLYIFCSFPPGKNDGSIGGKQYFRCSPGYGLLVRPGRVRRAAGAGRRRSAGLRLQGTPEPRRSSALSGSATNLASLTAALAKAEGTAALGADRSHKNPENRKSWAS